MTSTKQFKKDETVECVFCSFWLLRKTLPSHLRKHHMDKFAGPDPENCLDFSEFDLNIFCRERRFNRDFYVKKIIKMREQWVLRKKYAHLFWKLKIFRRTQWKEPASGGKRGAAIEQHSGFLVLRM